MINMPNDITLKSVRNLLGMNFFIPSYQRGYRWTEQQVKDLLNDIKEFIDNGTNNIYCIQPLVVKEREQDILSKIKKANSIDEVKQFLLGSWEVIDGQQRLTTIKIILTVLQEKSYELEYETRTESKDFLNDISRKNNAEAESNIDFYHMHKAYVTISNWFNGKDESFKTMFLETLKSKVQFIWYETKEVHPIEVFTRLNIGKIALTDSELIKALFLNASNFKNQDQDSIRLQQIDIANEWDEFEYTLQNDEFWLFIQNELKYSKPTRIDYIFDLIRRQDALELKELLTEYTKISNTNLDEKELKNIVNEKYREEIGIDEHTIFRYFYLYFNLNKHKIDSEWLRQTWLIIKRYFQIFKEWFNDLELYHYVGFLVERGEKIESLIKKYNGEKEAFVNYIKTRIKDKLKDCNNLQQEYEKGKPKTACYPLLLLYNLQTVIAQNKKLEENKYGMSIFYKFPFHLMKEENWDMEHIDSDTTNPLTKFSDQKEWLNDCLNEITDQNIKSEIIQFVEAKDQPENFDKLAFKIDQYINKGCERLQEPKKEGDVNQKNLIWNYCLLDSSTNRSYGNAIFPAKRRRIIQKDKGENGVSFIPPCTKNVFLKYYNQQTNVLRCWERQDAKAYLMDINNVLSIADFIEDQKEKIDKL